MNHLTAPRMDELVIDTDLWLHRRVGAFLCDLTTALGCMQMVLATDRSAPVAHGVLAQALVAARTPGGAGAVALVSTRGRCHRLSAELDVWRYTDPDYGPVALVAADTPTGPPARLLAYRDLADLPRWRACDQYVLSCPSCDWRIDTSAPGPQLVPLVRHANHDAADPSVSNCQVCRDYRHRLPSQSAVQLAVNNGWAPHCPACHTHLGIPT